MHRNTPITRNIGFIVPALIVQLGSSALAQDEACCLRDSMCVDSVSEHILFDGGGLPITCTGDGDCPAGGVCRLCAVANEVDCGNAGGFWNGPGNLPPETEPIDSCASNVCDLGSCCFGAGDCEDRANPETVCDPAAPLTCMSRIQCQKSGGSFKGGERCDFPTPPCPTCEIQDGSNCQLWEDSSLLLAASDLSTPGGGIVRADDFVPLYSQTLTKVCVWGAYLDGRNAPGPIPEERFDCAAVVSDNFTVTIYDDAGGMPGTVIGTSTATNVFREPAPDDQWQSNFDGAGVMYAYQLELDEPITGLTPGNCHWLEVANDTASPEGEAPNTCIWMWSIVEISGNNYSFAGTHNSAQAVYQPGGALPDDMAFCIDSGMVPGGCIPVTAACCECDATTGKPTGVCDVRTFDDCQKLTRSWDLTAPNCPGDACSGGTPGDDCASDAIAVTGDSVSIPFDTTCTTTDGPAIMPSEHGNMSMGKDIWVAYTASCSGTVTASMCSAGSQFDSAIGLFFDPDNPTTCACPGDSTATAVEGNDEGCTGYGDLGAGYVSRIARGGECMLIRVGGFEGDRGVGMLNIDCVPLPCLRAPTPIVHLVRHSGGFYVPARNNRFLSIVAGDAGRMQAIRITFVSLPPPYDVWNGEQLFVGEPSQLSELPSLGIGDPVGDSDFINIAPLECDPMLADFGSMGPIHIYHEGIIPGGQYDVQAIDSTCDMADESSYSAPATIWNARWGDVVSAYNPIGQYWGAYDDRVDVATDVVAMIDKFEGKPDAPSKFMMELEPRDIDGKINITEITVVLDAFEGEPYPFSPSAPEPCP